MTGIFSLDRWNMHAALVAERDAIGQHDMVAINFDMADTDVGVFALAHAQNEWMRAGTSSSPGPPA